MVKKHGGVFCRKRKIEDNRKIHPVHLFVCEPTRYFSYFFLVNRYYKLGVTVESAKPKGSKYVVDKFYMNGKPYNGSRDVEKYSDSLNRFYVVRYASQNPNWNELLDKSACKRYNRHQSRRI